MKNYRAIVAATLFTLLLATQCKKDEPKPAIDLTQLSGNWSGNFVIIRKGNCSFLDSTAVVDQVWTVTKAGEVTIHENHYFSTSSGSDEWIGKVDQNLTITISREQNVNCFGTLETKSFTLSGQIQKTPTGFILDQTADFPLCPPQCLFDQHYIISK